MGKCSLWPAGSDKVLSEQCNGERQIAVYRLDRDCGRFSPVSGSHGFKEMTTNVDFDPSCW